MIIVMKSHATVQQVELAKARLIKMGFGVHTIEGEQRTVIGATGDKRTATLSLIEEMEGVERVVPILQPYKLASREYRPTPSTITVGNVTIGGGTLVVAAGPCAVETQEQMMEVARCVKAAGAQILRGGAYKPRTSPYAFQGHKELGLEMLRQAADSVGMPIITEVVEPGDVEVVATYSDILQIGARNMQNFSLLREAGRTRRAVMLKRGLAATVDEWLMAAEYILSEGNENVILCERGIRTYETATRNTLDLSAIPLLKSLTHLPVFADPSHGTGKRILVPAMSRAALAAGADGLIIEVHPNPAEALSDGPQSLEPPQFAKLMAELRRVHSLMAELELQP